MPPIKKKINANTVANTEAKSIDSFFASFVPNKDNENIDNSLDKPSTNNVSVNILDAKVSKCVDDKEELTKETILKKLTQHKILFSHIEIKNKVDNLSENEVTEIFKIIKIINLSTLKKNTIQEMCNFLFFCDNNNKAIDEEEIERAKYKEIIYDN